VISLAISLLALKIGELKSSGVDLDDWNISVPDQAAMVNDELPWERPYGPMDGSTDPGSVVTLWLGSIS
jgi:hypothetical protein